MTPLSSLIQNSVIVDIGNTIGTIPVARGGTGLASSGTANNVLTSTGSVWNSIPMGGVWTRITTTTNATTRKQYITDTTSAAFTVTLPASPAAGDYVYFMDAGNWAVNNLTVARNGSTIEASVTDLVLDVRGLMVQLIFDGTTWQVMSNIGPQGIQGVQGNIGPQGATGATGANGSFSGLAMSMDTFLATPTSANLRAAVTDETGTGALVFGTNPILSGATISGFTESVIVSGTIGAAVTIDISAGTVITAILTSATPCTFTMPTAVAGKSFTIMLKQPASAVATTATFTGVKWGSSGAPTITATIGKMDILSFVSDGTSWYGSASQGFTY
jgi:hypothetical protein